MTIIVPSQDSPAGFVYIFRCQQYFKIGQAVDVKDRLRNVQTNNPFLVTVVKIIPTKHMSAVESFLHEKFRPYRERGEWFLLPAEAVNWLKSFDGIDLRATADMIAAFTKEMTDLEELIALRFGRGMSPSAVAKSLPGYSARKYKEYMEKVAKVEATLAEMDPAEAVEETA